MHAELPRAAQAHRGRILPALLLALLFAGAVAHFGHHWLDPHCDDSGTSSHPCACSALHGAVEPAIALSTLAAPPPYASWIPLPALASVTLAVLAHHAPRAPPLA